MHKSRRPRYLAVSNHIVIDKILRDVGDHVPKFRPGQRVSGRGHVGVIDSIYANLDAAIGSFIVPEGWYERLSIESHGKPKAPKRGFWYGIVLEEGAVLLGEDDIDGTSQ